MTNTTDTNTRQVAIDPATEVGLLSLTVADLARSVDFYTEAIGLALLDRDAAGATLGVADSPLLLLREHPGAAAWPRGARSYTGLYHFALLVPTRADLGRWLRHWLEIGFPPPGQGDHLVSEALYLEDPDGNGIEIYADRPRDEWQWSNGKIVMAANPVDMRGLLVEAGKTIAPWSGMSAGTKLGHVHLQVGDISEAERFYHGVLGFDVVAQMPSALFVSAGGYHHHLGMNTWHSQGAGPAPHGTVGLRLFTIDLPSEESREAVVQRLESAGAEVIRSGDRVTAQDPWHNTIVLQVGAHRDVRDLVSLTV